MVPVKPRMITESPDTVQAMLGDGAGLVLIDVREELNLSHHALPACALNRRL